MRCSTCTTLSLLLISEFLNIYICPPPDARSVAETKTYPSLHLALQGQLAGSGLQTPNSDECVRGGSNVRLSE